LGYGVYPAFFWREASLRFGVFARVFYFFLFALKEPESSTNEAGKNTAP
jgi:hypothetical protein